MGSIPRSGMTELNHKNYIVANKTTHTFELQGINSTNYTTYESGGGIYKKINTISGLSHLEGCEVAILADGATHPNKTVSSGSITLDRLAGIVQIGLPYTSTVRTLPVDIVQEVTTQFLRTKRANQLGIRILNTLGLSAGRPGNLERIPFRSSDDNMGSSPSLETSLLKRHITMNPNNILQIEIQSTDPLPCTILSLVTDMNIDETAG